MAGTVNGTGPPLHIRVPELVRQRAPQGSRPLSAALRHWMPLAGVAAALLLLVFGWRELVLPQPASTTVVSTGNLGADPLVRNLMEQHLRLAQALSLEGRLETLAAMTADLEREMADLRILPQGQEIVKELETLQRKLVNHISTSGRRPV